MSDKAECGNNRCDCGVNRREFVKMTGLTAAGVLLSRLSVMAGPFTREDFTKLVPADKKLSSEWVKSLFDRGTPELWTGEQLKYIGLPIGGLCAGQLYLGGDGKLWHWDIFNKFHPMRKEYTVSQGFSMRVGGVMKPLEKFAGISFRGEYPIGTVKYQEKGVLVTLKAFSPFIPLNTDDSSLPATVMQFTVKNTGSRQLETELTGHLAKPGMVNRIVTGNGFTFLECASTPEPPKNARPDIVFEDWNKTTYAGWKVEGTAFGRGPIKKSDIPRYQGDVGGDTERVVNSHATAPGRNMNEKDAPTGKLTSRPFTIKRNFINFWVGGGNRRGQECMNFVVDGKVAHRVTGELKNQMSLQSFDVREYRGKSAYIEIVDEHKGIWSNIGVGKITFSDLPVGGHTEQPCFGSMGLALLGDSAASSPTTDHPTSLQRKLSLAPGQSEVVTFLVTWHFPNLDTLVDFHNTDPLPHNLGRYYAARFASALSVAQYCADHFERLSSQTFLWRDTWYDSTLPYWFLDRTMINTSTLATSTCHRFKNGRFYGWEGVGCCAGTSGHVWHYAHAVARLFPELERDTRERVDFGFALQPDGAIHYRGECKVETAIDAQAGYILRALREHQMTNNNAFLKRNWAGIKRATQWLIARDADGDGFITDAQHNTLDREWYGPVAWLSGLYVAALAAAAVMADEMGDTGFAKQCREIFARGKKNLTEKLFNGEYYINIPDPKHLDTVNSGGGCHIDQVMGQSWAWHVGLPRVFPEKETKSALRSLWTYNFAPDVGPYRKVHKPGRWFGYSNSDPGLIMCTFPRTDWTYEQACGKGNTENAGGYFNECMSGFEYQAASHMVREGLVLEGLAITRSIHDRHTSGRRNPYNEIECGAHYARAMASYGVFLAACGFEYDGPAGHIGFSPRMQEKDFRAAFTAAEGWGTYSQKLVGKAQQHCIDLKYGKLRVKTIALKTVVAGRADAVVVTLAGEKIKATHALQDGRILLTLGKTLVIKAGQQLSIEIKSE